MTHPHKVIWNWDISFGNILSIVLTIGAVAVAMVGGYVRYEKKFILTDERIDQVEEAIGINQLEIETHAVSTRIHVTKAEASLLFVPRLFYDVQENAQNARIRESQVDLKADLAEIKTMVRDNGKAGLEQYRQLTNRIDQIVDP